MNLIGLNDIEFLMKEEYCTHMQMSYSVYHKKQPILLEISFNDKQSKLQIFLFLHMPPNTLERLWMANYRQFKCDVSHLHLFEIMHLFECVRELIPTFLL